MAFVRELTKHRLRTVKSCILGLVFVGLGGFLAVLGPSLLDLQGLADVSIERAAGLLPARSAGYAIGSVVAGISAERFDHQIILMIAMTSATITTFLFPLFPNMNIMYGFNLLSGIANGCIDTVGNCWIIHLWGSENAPFMQCLHFMFGVGSFIAPFLAEPFLLKRVEDPDSDFMPIALALNSITVFNSTTEFTAESSDFVTTMMSTTKKVKYSSGDFSAIKWPFIIIGTYYLLVLTLLIVVYILYPDNSVHPSRTRRLSELDENSEKDKFRLLKPISGNFRLYVIAIATLGMHAYVGLEISFGSLLSPFAVKSNLKMSKSEGSFLTSTYWGTYTFLRVFSLIAIIYLSPRTLLAIDFGIIFLANFVLVPFANTRQWALWLGSALMGLGCSSVFATIFAFLEQLTPITSRITAGFLVAACAGEFIIPLVVASYLEKTPSVFLWTVLFYTLVSFSCVLVLFYIQYKLLYRQSKEQQNELRTCSNQIVSISTISTINQNNYNNMHGKPTENGYNNMHGKPTQNGHVN